MEEGGWVEEDEGGSREGRSVKEGEGDEGRREEGGGDWKIVRRGGRRDSI